MLLMSPDARNDRTRRLVLGLAVAMSLVALGQVVSKARHGRQAIIKWGPDIEAMWAGEGLYHRTAAGEEGYPTLPLSAILMTPFRAAGDVGGSVLFAVFKLVLAWYLVSTALALAAGSVRAFPPWGAALVLALGARVLLSDFAHGNVNVVVAALIAATAALWVRGRDGLAGVAVALGAVLKVTPALFLVYLAWKRSLRGLLGFVAGVAVFAFLLPGVLLGWQRNLDLAHGWWLQMVEPYVSGAPLTAVQTEQINQSMLGVAARLLTDCVAIQASPPRFDSAVRIHWLALEEGSLRLLLGVLFALMLAWTLRCVGRTRIRDGARVLGEFALFALLALFLSERSWKQHYVVLVFAHAYLISVVARGGVGAGLRRAAAAALVLSALLHGLSGSGILGARGSDFAEAYGAFLAGGLVLFVVIGCLLREQIRSAGTLRPESLETETSP
jgi:hypothetical protein